MEDYEAQEVEFWAKLEEEGVSRSSMLRRSAAAAFGLTVARQFRHRTRARLAPASPLRPPKGTPGGMSALIKAAKKEGHLNTIALPPDWANYGEMMSTFTKKYGIGITNDNPNGSSARGEPGRSRRSRATRVHPTRSTSASRSRSPAPARACTRSTSTRTSRRSRAAMKDTRGFWMRRLLGCDLDRLQRRR